MNQRQKDFWAGVAYGQLFWVTMAICYFLPKLLDSMQ